MKQKIFGILFIALALSVLARCLGPSAESWEAWDDVPKSKRIDSAYEFSPAPGSDEWAALKTLEEKIEKTKIPENTLIRLTGDALIKTIRTHPLLPVVLSLEPDRAGFDKLISYMNCAGEFASRADAEELLLQFVTEVNGEEDSDSKGDSWIKLYFFDRLLRAYNEGGLSADPRSIDGRTHKDIPQEERITAAYGFPVVPETDEWRALGSLEQMIDATKIPDDTLVSMTTEALLETFLAHPLAVNLIAFDTPEAGVKNLLSYMDCLQELASRQDAGGVIWGRYAEKLTEIRGNAPETWRDYLLSEFALRYFALYSEEIKPSYRPITLDESFVAGLY